MKGETVKVKTFVTTGTDPFGGSISTETVSVVDNVLVQPGACADIIESNRPNGSSIRYTLHFPKTFYEDLEGCQVEVRGNWYDVVGKPDHYTLENTPTQWWLTVEVGAVNG